MSGAAKKVLIIGGGFSGMSAAIELRKRGVAVDMVEIDKGWRSYGAGISLGGPTLRAFKTLGIIDEFLKRGAGTDGVDLHLPNGMKLASIPAPRLAGPDIPGGGGIMRPVLAEILSQATRAAGVNVKLGETFAAIEQDEDAVSVAFTDGTKGRYDLAVGADGLYSKLRETIFPDAPKPAYMGQIVWRAVIDRPATLDRVKMWVGPKVKIGMNPVSTEKAYVFLTEDRATKLRLDESHLVAIFKGLLSHFTAPEVVEFREGVNEANSIVYRPLESLLLPLPWHKGRIALIGDAAHATTPHLASGACIGIEDAIVLADELAKTDSVGAALSAFEARRWERCRLVVENSNKLGEIEINDGDKGLHAQIMGQSMMALAAPI